MQERNPFTVAASSVAVSNEPSSPVQSMSENNGRKKTWIAKVTFVGLVAVFLPLMFTAAIIHSGYELLHGGSGSSSSRVEQKAALDSSSLVEEVKVKAEVGGLSARNETFVAEPEVLIPLGHENGTKLHEVKRLGFLLQDSDPISCPFFDESEDEECSCCDGESCEVEIGSSCSSTSSSSSEILFEPTNNTGVALISALKGTRPKDRTRRNLHVAFNESNNRVGYARIMKRDNFCNYQNNRVKYFQRFLPVAQY